MLRLFPSSGADVAAVGYCQSNLSVQFVSASTGDVVATVQLAVGGYLPSAAVYDWTTGYLYLAGWTPASSQANNSGGFALTQVDTVNYRVTGTASLPNGSEPVSLCVGPERGTILVADRGNGEVYPVNPSSGSIVGPVVPAAGVRHVSFDLFGGLLFVSRQNGSAQPLTEVFAQGSATPKWVLPDVEAGDTIRDASSGTFYLWTYQNAVVAVNAETGATEGSLMLSGQASQETYVPAYHEFVVGQVADFGMQLATQDPSLVDTPGPSYSAIPLTGSATPLVAGVAIAIVGLGQLFRPGGRRELATLRDRRARAREARLQELRLGIESEDFHRRP